MNLDMYRTPGEREQRAPMPFEGSPILQRFIELDASQFVETESGGRIIKDVVVSTEDVDSHRSIIKLDGWDLRRYEANPVLDWMHAATSHETPSPDALIGQALVHVGETPAGVRALLADLHFASDELSNIAGKIYKQMKAKLLRGLSVALIPKLVTWKMLMPDGAVVDEPPQTPEGDAQFMTMLQAGARDLAVIERAELTAIGVVMVPSNPNTLANSIATLRAQRPLRQVQVEADMRRAKDAAERTADNAAVPQGDTMQVEQNETVAAPVVEAPVDAPATETATREIADEARTNAMKAMALCGEACMAASKALGGEDEQAALTACQAAYDACRACVDACAAVVPEYAKAKGTEEAEMSAAKTVAPVWARELTGTEDEAAQRGVVEAWHKSHGELIEARARVAELRVKLTAATTSTRAVQVTALLDAASRKLTPAERKSYESRSYEKDEDVSWLRAHLDTLTERTELAPPTAQLVPPAEAPLNDDERKVAKQLHMSEADFIEHKRKLAAEAQRDEDSDEG